MGMNVGERGAVKMDCGYNNLVFKEYNTNEITTMNDINIQQMKLHDKHTSNENTQRINKYTIKKLCRKNIASLQEANVGLVHLNKEAI